MPGTTVVTPSVFVIERSAVGLSVSVSVALLLPGLALAGAAYDGLGISSCIASGHRSAEALIDELVLNEEAQP